MNTIRAMCDNVIVMKNGTIVEQNKNTTLFQNPQQDYTKKLIESSFVFDL